jgi:hypothetical protein
MAKLIAKLIDPITAARIRADLNLAGGDQLITDQTAALKRAIAALLSALESAK